MSDCILCQLLSGELPVTFVYRDEECAALMDIQPVNHGHVLVIPTNTLRISPISIQKPRVV
jgi:histidine triad (HIT) family protein